MKMKTIVATVVTLTLVFAFAAVATAGPRNDQYSPKTTQVTSKPKTVVKISGAHASQPAPPAASAAAGALPFTGFQLGIAVAIGAGLVGAGLFLRRMGRPRGSDS